MLWKLPLSSLLEADHFRRQLCPKPGICNLMSECGWMFLLFLVLHRLQNSRIFCERERRTIFERKVWSEWKNGEGELWETPCGSVRLARFTLEARAYGGSRLPKTTVLLSKFYITFTTSRSATSGEIELSRNQSNSIRGLSSIEFGNRTKSSNTDELCVSSIS